MLELRFEICQITPIKVENICAPIIYKMSSMQFLRVIKCPICHFHCRHTKCIKLKDVGRHASPYCLNNHGWDSLFQHLRALLFFVFTPKIGEKNAGTRSSQNCVDQGIDCIRIDINWFRYDSRIGSLWMTSVDSDDELWLALGNYMSGSTKRERLGSKLS